MKLSPFVDAFFRAFCGIGAGVNWLTDVAPHAKRNCAQCFGRGTVMFNKRLAPCDCAGRRFMAANREHVDVLANGDVVWKLSPLKITL